MPEQRKKRLPEGQVAPVQPPGPPAPAVIAPAGAAPGLVIGPAAPSIALLPLLLLQRNVAAQRPRAGLLLKSSRISSRAQAVAAAQLADPQVAPPTLDYGAPPQANQGEAYSLAPTYTGTGVTFAVTTGSLPDGLSLNASTGEISGTPTTAGDSTFTVTATNAGGSASQTITISVASGSFSDDFSGDLSKWDEMDPYDLAAISGGAWSFQTGAVWREASLWAIDTLPAGESVYEISFDVPTISLMVYFACWCDEAARAGVIENSWAGGRVGYVCRASDTTIPGVYTMQGATVSALNAGAGVSTGCRVLVRLTIFANGDRRIEWHKNGVLLKTVDIAAASVQAGVGSSWGIGFGDNSSSRIGTIDNVLAERIS